MENQNKLGQKPAFPTDYGFQENIGTVPDSGMSKRFYAATAIAQGLCGNSNYVVNTNKASEFANVCYRLADELLKQENGESNG